MSYAQIVGWGYAVPSRIMTNLDLEKMVDTSDEWIRSRTGISERRIAGPKETTGTLAIRAAQNALQVADLSPSKVDLIIVATSTPDNPMPAVASQVQDGIGASRAGAFDLNAACSGFVYAMSVASGLIAGGLHERILVIGADTMSRIVDWSDRSTCVLFGDGAGAILLQRSETPTGLRAAVLGSDGSGINSLYIPAGGSRLPLTPELLQSRKNCISMKGSEVYRFAVQTVAHATNQALNAAGLDIDDIDLFIPHQANIRIIQSAAKSLKIPAEKVYTNVHRYGNTSAASIPIALCEAVESGRVQAGANLAIVGFGAGLSWGAAVVQWGLDTTPVPISWWKSVVRNFHRREAVVRSFALRTQRRLDALRRLNGVHEA
ncbi:MAG TPA: beta-ketoacyl-ACP synthase III [Chloroflexota bacterium]|nr:beta-ketoacyl-ACP synthase III [Chloroflexota bacterium]